MCEGSILRQQPHAGPVSLMSLHSFLVPANLPVSGLTLKQGPQSSPALAACSLPTKFDVLLFPACQN